MKKHIFLVSALVLMTVLPGCNKKPEQDNPPLNPDDPVIIMTSEIPAFVQIYLSGIGTATIYWGDGKPETFKLSVSLDNAQGIYHSYYSGSGVTLITGKNITGLRCNDSKLTDLDVSKNKALLTLDCAYNQLTNLDVSTIPYLKDLYCENNRLTSLNVSENIGLLELRCYYNQLTSLDVSNSIFLLFLQCSINQLVNLDVGNNTKLCFLTCFSNQFTSAALNALFETLPINNNVKYKDIHIYDNPGTAGCDRSIAERKGWTPIDL